MKLGSTVKLIICIALTSIKVSFGQGNSSFDFNQIGTDFLLGKINYQTDNRFRLVDSFHTNRPIYLLVEVADAFEAMADAAYKDGVCIDLLSGARNFKYQQYLWNKKWKKYDTLVHESKRVEHILHYTALPGASRHHWGTEIDLISFYLSYYKSNEGKAAYEWLQEHAIEFGFCQVYSNNPSRTGYREEKWHWSYLPISTQLLSQYLEEVEANDLINFQGSQYFDPEEFIQEYVKGVDCSEEIH